MRVLFVEDNAVNRLVVCEMLTAGGIHMDQAENGLVGLSKIEESDYDLVLMDLRMPLMDGLTAIRKLRARADHKARVPVIVITADIAADVRTECLASGADEILQKPISMQLLFDAIGRIVASGDPGRAMLA